MKSIFLITLIFLTATLFAQSTTQNEYNFMAKGLKRVVEEGADMKAGYSQEKFHEQKFDVYSFQAVKILRADQSLAGTVIVCDDAGAFGGREYYVIPHKASGSSVYGFQDYYRLVGAFQESKARAFAKFLAVIYAMSE